MKCHSPFVQVSKVIPVFLIVKCRFCGSEDTEPLEVIGWEHEEVWYCIGHECEECGYFTASTDRNLDAMSCPKCGK